MNDARVAGERLATAARGGDRRALARLLTSVERGSAVAEAALRELYRHARDAHVVGVTGPPGVGKSTLVAALVGEVTACGRAVAVLAIDPSSPITGGAILGDRVRMQRHASDPGVFIRSMAARGQLGGLAATTANAASVLAACGFGMVIVETVGTGQSEVEVASLADTTVVLQAPDTGDDVQAIKAGLLEVADIVAVTKADRPGADRTAASLRAMLTVGASRDPGPGRPRRKRPDVMLVSGTTGAGVPELLAAIDRLASGRGAEEDVAAARMARATAQVEAVLVERMRRELRSEEHRSHTEAVLQAVAAHDLDPVTAAERLSEVPRSGR